MKLLKLFILLFITFLLAIAGCKSKEKEGANPEDIIGLLKQYCCSDEILKIYTDKTIVEFNRFKNIAKIDEPASYSILSFIPEKAEVEIVSEKCEESVCTLSIRFISHPVENMRGFSTDILLKKEDNAWKIDRSRDFRDMCASAMKQDAGGYFKNLWILR